MKKKFGHQGHAEEDMVLQITSMADVFTIILVFLLKSFASGAVTLSPAAGTQLPVAHAESISAEALKLEITETSIQVDGHPVLTLHAFRFDARDADAESGGSRVLMTALERERKKQALIAGANSDVKVDSKVLVIADSRTPYSTIKTALASAAAHGFSDFKLVVIQPEG